MGRERTCDIVYTLVDDNIHSLLGRLVRCYVGCGKGLRHFEWFVISDLVPRICPGGGSVARIVLER